MTNTEKLREHMIYIGVNPRSMEFMMAKFAGVEPPGFPVVAEYDRATGIGKLISKSCAPVRVRLIKVPIGSRTDEELAAGIVPVGPDRDEEPPQ